MEPTVLHTTSEAETVALGRALAPLLAADDVVSLTGDLGAGKTALVKGVAAGLGVVEPVVSPTFNILLVHPGRLTLDHFDLYRLDAEAELEDVDFFGTLESGGVSVIEWGERFPSALPADHLAVSLRIVGDDDREITLAPSGARSGELAAAWAAAFGGVRP
jgi:tRNA threonylcarbamoyladenosine biosynthesis protein TsaE